MSDAADLFLHEQVLLLALHDEKGTVHDSMFAYAVAGAMVSELLLRGSLRLEPAKKKKLAAMVAVIAVTAAGTAGASS